MAETSMDNALMAKEFEYDALIKFSEKQKTIILDINELFGINPENVYKTNIVFNLDTPEIIEFLEANGFRVNAHHLIKNGAYVSFILSAGTLSFSYLNI